MTPKRPRPVVAKRATTDRPKPTPREIATRLALDWEPVLVGGVQFIPPVAMHDLVTRIARVAAKERRAVARAITKERSARERLAEVMVARDALAELLDLARCGSYPSRHEDVEAVYEKHAERSGKGRGRP